MRRIVYLSWPAHEISGGIKMVFRHVETLRQAGYEAGVATPDAQPPKPWFAPMVAPDDDGGHYYLSADFAFCERARRVGVPILLDTSIQLGCLGQQGEAAPVAATPPPSPATVPVTVHLPRNPLHEADWLACRPSLTRKRPWSSRKATR